MKLKGKGKLLKVYIGESDRVGGKLLYEEIVKEARKDGLAGATVSRGVMSYGASHSIHTMKIFALSSDLPIIIEIVDTIEKIEFFLPKLNQLLEKSKKGGLAFIEDIEVYRYQKGEKYNG